MKNQPKKQYSSFVKKNNKIEEMIYDPVEEKTAFVTILDGIVKTSDSIAVNEQSIYPLPPENKLVSNKVVLFPSCAEEFGSEKELLIDIQTFIHKYLEVSEFFEKISPFYILLTWVYDSFKELPYLRAIGDYGCGKSRFLKVLGSICYKPAFTAGATNPAPIFRIIDQFKGTLVIDEADMRFSDTNAEVVKILNNGFQTGMPVLRCANGEKNYEVESYDVFGPKIVATRERYEDKALESRFIVEQMDGKLSRKDIPINLDDTFDEEALKIRNKCLMWRLLNYGKKKIDTSLQDRTIEPRLNQVITPLISIIDDQDTKIELMEFVKKYNGELVSDRSMSYEAPILLAIIGLVKEGKDKITMEDIAERYNFGIVKGEKELSGRKVGIIVREKFGFRNERKNIGYVLDMGSYNSRIERLCNKYGFGSELVNLVNIVEGEVKDKFIEEMRDIGYKDLPNF